MRVNLVRVIGDVSDYDVDEQPIQIQCASFNDLMEKSKLPGNMIFHNVSIRIIGNPNLVTITAGNFAELIKENCTVYAMITAPGQRGMGSKFTELCPSGVRHPLSVVQGGDLIQLYKRSNISRLLMLSLLHRIDRCLTSLYSQQPLIGKGCRLGAKVIWCTIDRGGPIEVPVADRTQANARSGDIIPYVEAGSTCEVNMKVLNGVGDPESRALYYRGSLLDYGNAQAYSLGGFNAMIEHNGILNKDPVTRAVLWDGSNPLNRDLLCDVESLPVGWNRFAPASPGEWESSHDVRQGSRVNQRDDGNRVDGRTHAGRGGVADDDVVEQDTNIPLYFRDETESRYPDTTDTTDFVNRVAVLLASRNLLRLNASPWLSNIAVLRSRLPMRDIIDLYALRAVSVISGDTATDYVAARSLTYPSGNTEPVIAFLFNGNSVYSEYNGDCEYVTMFWYFLRAYFFNTMEGTNPVTFCHVAGIQDTNSTYPCCYFKFVIESSVRCIRFTKYSHPGPSRTRHVSWTVFEIPPASLIDGLGANFPRPQR
jgi:hypothetical protein